VYSQNFLKYRLAKKLQILSEFFCENIPDNSSQDFSGNSNVVKMLFKEKIMKI